MKIKSLDCTFFLLSTWCQISCQSNIIYYLIYKLFWIPSYHKLSFLITHYIKPKISALFLSTHHKTQSRFSSHLNWTWNKIISILNSFWYPVFLDSNWKQFLLIFIMFKIILKLVLIYTYIMHAVTKLEIRTKALQSYTDTLSS